MLFAKFSECKNAIRAAIVKEGVRGEDIDWIESLTLTKAWYARESIDPDQESLCPWFCKIAKNTAIDWLRKRGRRREVPLSSVGDLPVPAKGGV